MFRCVMHTIGDRCYYHHWTEMGTRMENGEYVVHSLTHKCEMRIHELCKQQQKIEKKYSLFYLWTMFITSSEAGSRLDQVDFITININTHYTHMTLSLNLFHFRRRSFCFNGIACRIDGFFVRWTLRSPLLGIRYVLM